MYIAKGQLGSKVKTVCNTNKLEIKVKRTETSQRSVELKD